VGRSDFSARSAELELRGLCKRFRSLDARSAEVKAVDGIDLVVADGELVTLLGPSGCGKTTTLRMIAGFEFATEGSILIGGKDIARVPPNKRGISMVFQSYALFPHLSIWENVAYGLRVQRLPKAEIKAKTEKVLDLMQLTEMARRYPNQVSGGQQQRIALARAIVIEPRVLLFDEPLSNLDAKLREFMRDELRKLQKRLGITSVYVTHDQAEAMAISDRVVIMRDGRIRQVGRPRDVYEWPRSRFVANFMGKANFIPAQVEGREGEAAVARVAGKALLLPRPGPVPCPTGQAAALVVRPESIRLKREGGLLRGRVTRTTYFGGVVVYEVESEGLLLIVEDHDPQGTGVFDEGEGVGIDLELDAVRLLPNDGE
jgi:iron(III) transport system ATP-binding protein